MRPRRGEEGGALILALVFLSLFGLVIGSLLTFSSTGLRATAAVRDQRDRLYAADGAVDVAINRVRGDLAQGNAGGPCAAMSLALNSVATEVACEGMTGSGGGGSGGVNPVTVPEYALLTTGTAEDGVVQRSSSTLQIDGDMYSNSTVKVATNATLSVAGAVGAAGVCSGSVTSTAVPPSLSCDRGTTVADPGYPKAASSAPGVQAVPSGQCNTAGATVTFIPGTYRSAAALSALTSAAGACPRSTFVFPAGVYYFDFTDAGAHEWRVDDANASVIGGQLTGSAIPGACRTEASNPAATDGVQFVFGGDSRLNVVAGKVELCPKPSTTGQQIVVYGLTAGAATPSTTAPVPTATSSVTAFTSPAGALGIDGATSPASLSEAGGATTASITLSPYPFGVPAGSTIDAATLRLVHREAGDVRSVAATVRLGDGSVITSTSPSGNCDPTRRVCVHAALGEDRVDLKASGLTTLEQLSGLSVTYEVALANGKAKTATAELDGALVEIRYSPPAFRAPTAGDCIRRQPYVAGDPTGATCPLIRADGSNTTLALRGTVYAPLAVVDVNLPNQSRQIFGRGLVARALHIGVPASSSQQEPAIALPRSSGARADRRVLFTASVDGVARLRAVVRFADGGGTTPGAGAVVESWSVLR